MKKSLIFLTFLWIILLSFCTIHNKKLFKDDYSILSNQEFTQEIKRLYKITKHHKDPMIQRMACLHLGIILSHRNNPSPEYKKSIQEFENYFSKDQKISKKDSDEYLNYIAILSQIIIKTEKLKTTKEKLKKQALKNQKLEEQLHNKEKEIAHYKQELKKLKENIKTLDSLYFRIEKKKKKKD